MRLHTAPFSSSHNYTMLPVCLTSQNRLYLNKKSNQLTAQTCESISASRRSMIERWPLVGEAVGTSGPSVTGKPRISCTFDLPFVELTKALLDTKWLYLKTAQKKFLKTLTVSRTRDIPQGQMHYTQSEHEVKHAHVCVFEGLVSKTTEKLWNNSVLVYVTKIWFLSNQYNPIL
jgi:hypothetical protein